MKDDTNSKSTDFLPTKPTDDGKSNIALKTDDKKQAEPSPTVSVSSDTPAPPPPPEQTPASQHIIDLKNMEQPKTAKDFMVSQKPETSESTDVDTKNKLDLSQAEKPKAAPPIGMTPVNDPVKPAEKTDPQSGDQALKDAMVDVNTTTDTTSQPAQGNEQANTPVKKKKFPTWAIVLIIVLVIAIIAVVAFMLLNAFAPTGL